MNVIFALGLILYFMVAAFLFWAYAVLVEWLGDRP
jgi:hypothetical protein